MRGIDLEEMRFPASFIDEIIAHSLEGRPNEVCGLIAGHDGYPVKLYRATNSDPNPRVRYNVDPLELLNILREIDSKGWQLLAIYHSHPANEAYPSRTDVNLAYYPDAVYIIASLAGEQEPRVRAFRIVNKEITEIELVVDREAEQSWASR